MFDEVKSVVVETLGIQDRASTIDSSSPLLGSIPELDSMAVMEIVLAIEQRFNLVIDGADITGEIFETFGSLTQFVVEHRE